MLHFKCPQCDKALRTSEDKAGSHVKCPSCGNKFIVPDAAEEASPPQMEELQPQAKGLFEDEPPWRKKKSRRSGYSTAAARGKTLVIILASLWLAVLILSWISFFLAPDVDKELKQLVEMTQGEIDQQEAQQFQQEMSSFAHNVRIVTVVFMVVRLAVVAPFFIFLYLGHNWARIVVAVLSFSGAACGLYGIRGLVNGVGLLHGAHRVATILEVVLGEAVSLGLGITLLVSSRIKAHTSRT